MIVAPRGTSARLALRAAGFIATRTSGSSPGVSTSWSAKCSWKLETPGSVPWGARISAGKLGRVDRSLPRSAASVVNRSPVSCMPSPESPANRMTTRSSFTVSGRFGVRFGVLVEVDVGVDIAGITRIRGAPEYGHVNVALPASYVAVRCARRRLHQRHTNVRRRRGLWGSTGLGEGGPVGLDGGQRGHYATG